MDRQSSTEVQFVVCLECGEEQPDFGSNVSCEHCGEGPMPYYDEEGNLVS